MIKCMVYCVSCNKILAYFNRHDLNNDGVVDLESNTSCDCGNSSPSGTTDENQIQTIEGQQGG
jgi:hypothetical protein